MPFYGGDFLGNTLHLSGQEVGAYVLILWHCWEHGGAAPDDDRQLARIARVHPPHWKKIRQILQPLFDISSTPGQWISKRAVLELTKNEEISSKRKAAAKQKHTQSQSQSQSPSQSNKPITQRSLNLLRTMNFEVSCETGEGVGEAIKPPRHGARSRDGRFVYFKRGTSEFDAYAKDYQEGTGEEPVATADGRWFRRHGEVVSRLMDQRGNR